MVFVLSRSLRQCDYCALRISLWNFPLLFKEYWSLWVLSSGQPSDVSCTHWISYSESHWDNSCRRLRRNLEVSGCVSYPAAVTGSSSIFCHFFRSFSAFASCLFSVLAHQPKRPAAKVTTLGETKLNYVGVYSTCVRPLWGRPASSEYCHSITLQPIYVLQ